MVDVHVGDVRTGRRQHVSRRKVGEIPCINQQRVHDLRTILVGVHSGEVHHKGPDRGIGGMLIDVAHGGVFGTLQLAERGGLECAPRHLGHAHVDGRVAVVGHAGFRNDLAELVVDVKGAFRCELLGLAKDGVAFVVGAPGRGRPRQLGLQSGARSGDGEAALHEGLEEADGKVKFVELVDDMPLAYVRFTTAEACTKGLAVEGVGEAEFVAMREKRDATLGMPRLILPSVQVNMRAGHLPPAENNGTQYLKIPLNVL